MLQSAKGVSIFTGTQKGDLLCVIAKIVSAFVRWNIKGMNNQDAQTASLESFNLFLKMFYQI